MFHIVVCDDDNAITDYVKEILDKKYKRKIETVALYSAGALRKWVNGQDNGQTDIIILDIALGDEDGIALAKELRADSPQIKVILLSGYAQLASNVFDADPVYFLSKPIDEKKLFAAVEKAMEIVQNQEIQAITVAGSCGKIHRIKLENVLYMETSNRYCNIHLDNGDCIEVMMKLSDIINETPDYIIGTHQSFACNIFKIKFFSKEDGIMLNDGTKIPVSRRYFKNVKERIALHI